MPLRSASRLLGASCVAVLAIASSSSTAAAERPISLGGRALADGRPLGGVRVELQPIEEWHAASLRRLAGEPVPVVARTTAGDDGRFALEVPGPGMWRLVASRDGFVAVQHWLLPLTEPHDLPDAHLERDVGLVVRVVDEAGRPLAGAEVRVRDSFFEPRRPWPAWRPALRQATSDEHGRLRLPRLAGEGVVLAAWAPGRLEAEARVETAAGAEVTIALPAGVERRVVVHQGDRAVAGAVVHLGQASWPAAATGEDGTATVALPAAGTVRLQVDAGGGWRTEAAELPFGVAAPAADTAASPSDPNAAPPPLVLELPSAWTLDGVVVTAGGGQPIAGALVWPRSSPSDVVRTDARGRFRLLRVDRGEVEVRAAAPGYVAAARPVAPGERELPRLVLAANAAIAGTVIDVAGTPIPRAEVWLREDAGNWQPWSGAPGPLAADERTWTDAAGRFRFAGRAHGERAELRAAAPGFAPATAFGEAGAAPLVLVLEEGRQVRGRLVDERGEPVVGVRVGLAWMPETRPWMEVHVEGRRVFDFETTSGADGRFAVADLPAGEYDAVADGRPSWAERELGAVRVPEQGGVDLGEVTLARAVALDLRVVDEDGQPVAGARVSPQRSARASRAGGVSSHGDGLAASSDAEGRLRLPGLTPGEPVTLRVRHEEFRPTEVPAVVPPLDDELEVVLERGLTLTGRVVASDGRPASRASLSLVQEWRIEHSGGSNSQTSTIGGQAEVDGSFAFRSLEPAPRLALTATWEGERASLELTDLPERGTLGPFELRLEPAPRLLGTVERPDGEPAAGAQVTLVRSGAEPAGGSPRAETARTDAAGRFSLVAEAPGPARVEAVLEDLAARADVVLVPGDTQVALTLDTPEGPGVAGRVVDADGRPVRAQVQVSCVEGCSDSTGRSTEEDGRFVFRDLARGRYTVEASAPGLASAERTLDVAAQWIGGIELVLRPGSAIEGTIRGVEPEERRRVSVVAFPAEGSGRMASGAVDHRGGYRVGGLSPGRWRVTARSEATGVSAEGEVELHPGDEVARLDLELARDGVRLTGRVTVDGQPAADLGLSLVRQDDGTTAAPLARVRTAFDGSFRFAGVEPGRYRLEVQPNLRVPPVRRSLDLVTDREIRLDVVVSSVEGRVVVAGGAPASGLRAALVGPEGGELYTPVAADGRFRFPVVAAGPYVLTARRDGSTLASQPLEVGPADLTGVLLLVEE